MSNIIYYPDGTFQVIQDTLEVAQATRSAAVDAQYASLMSAGFPWNFGTEDAQDIQTLQIATLQDQLNWTIFQTSCEEAIAASAGDSPMPIAMRVMANKNYTVTANQAITILNAMRTYGASLMAWSWSLKDQIIAATTTDAVYVIVVATGWPGQS